MIDGQKSRNEFIQLLITLFLSKCFFKISKQELRSKKFVRVAILRKLNKKDFEGTSVFKLLLRK